MPELNPSEQGCLLQLFTGDFKFYCLLLKKKAYLIDFSFKFNGIKFCTLLMNWLIQGGGGKRKKTNPIDVTTDKKNH